MKERLLKMLSAGLTLCMAVSSVMLTAPAVSAASSVVVAVEAFTVDYGFVVYPTTVEIAMGDTGATVLEKALPKASINKGSGVGTGNVTSIAMDTDSCSINSDISSILDDNSINYEDWPTTDGWLANGDYIGQSTWVFILNNKKSTSSLANYVPQNGDVIRISYSVYGGGSDLGFDSKVFPAVTRDELYKQMALKYTPDTVDGWIEGIAMSLLSTQEEINEGVAMVKEEQGIDPDDGDDAVDTDDGTDSVEPPSTDGTASTTPAPSTTAALTTKGTYTNPEGNKTVPNAGTTDTGVTLIPAIILTAASGTTLFATRKKKNKK